MVLGQGRTYCRSLIGAAAGGSAQHLLSAWPGRSRDAARGMAERSIPGSTRDAPAMLRPSAEGSACLPKEKSSAVSSHCQSLGKASCGYLEVLCHSKMQRSAGEQLCREGPGCAGGQQADHEPAVCPGTLLLMHPSQVDGVSCPSVSCRSCVDAMDFSGVLPFPLAKHK